MLWIVLDFLLYGLALYGFHDHGGFHSSTTMHEFLKSWWFRGFIWNLLILGVTAIFVRFYAFDSFGWF